MTKGAHIAKKAAAAFVLLAALVLGMLAWQGSAYADTAATKNTTAGTTITTQPSVTYKVHVQTYGWEKAWKKDGQTSGTTGKSKRLEGIYLKLENAPATGSIEYKTHVQKVGWQGWQKDGALSGTTGRSLRLEAIQIRLTGEMAKKYDVYYRVHAQTFGWMGWAKNGESAGTQGYSKRLEAIQMKLVTKGGKAPGPTAGAFKKTLTKNQQLASMNTASGQGLKVFGGSYNLNSAAGKRLKKAIDSINKSGKLSFVMMDLQTGIGVSYAPNRVLYSASVLKGPYVAAVNKYKPGSVSGKWKNTMKQTITVSSNEGYSALRSHYGSGVMKSFMGYTNTSGRWGYARKYTHVTSKDLAKLWVGNYDYFYVNTNKNSSWCRGLYTHSLNSFIYKGLKGKYKVHSKPGWYPSPYNVQNDAGIVMVDGHPYVISVMSTAYGQYGKLSELVKALDAVHTDMVK